MVLYPMVADAEAALSGFLRTYAPDAGQTGAVRTENGKWTMARRQGELLAIVFDAPTEEKAGSFMESVKAKRGEDIDEK